MKNKIRAVSAINLIIIAHPAFTSKTDEWEIVICDTRGHWQSATTHPNKQAALKARASLFTLHRKLAKERKMTRQT